MIHGASIVQGSREFVYADLRADRVLSTQAVAMAITTDEHPTVWTTAEWATPPGKVRSARILLDGSLPAGTYNVFAKITDAPEIPIVFTGKLKII